MINIKCRLLLKFILLILISISLNDAKSQTDSVRLSQLIKETNEQFLYPYAPGIFLSPFEIIEHNRKRIIKNIEMVDAVTYFREFKTSLDTIPFIIQDNLTIISKPDDKYNSYTYVYLKDGKISKNFRGRHLNDYYVYDENGYLIQHGYGGELKKAKRTDKTFEWYRQKDNHLEFITSYDENNQLLYFNRFRQKESSLALLSTLDLYTWSGQLLKSKTEIKHWEGGGADSTFLRIEYGPLGIIKSAHAREGKQENWSSIIYSTRIDTIDNNKIRIAIEYKDKMVEEITFDQHDNWIEMKNSSRTIRREIKYRSKRRR